MPAKRFDPISGLLDRRSCIAVAEQLTLEASAHGSFPLAVLWIDLDRFLQVNQSFGHEGGDAMIFEVAARLRRVVGGNACLGRMGGDEFICIVTGEDEATCQMLAESLLAAIAEPVHLGGITLYPSASIGLALYEHEEDGLNLLQRADRAMIAAKRRGGSNYVVSGKEPIRHSVGTMLAREELDIESKLHSAMDNGGLQLHYQPILGADGQVEAVEALMRCTVRGESIPPSKFIPVAEKTGLVIRLGEWTMIQGAQFAGRLRDAGMPVKVAVNVSRAQLLAPHFAQTLNAALICGRISPELLELELTESLFMDMSGTVQDNLFSARAAGVGLAIDDFGTGYSCLANLKDIHATKLKLDRSFVIVLPDDPRAFSIVKAMTHLGQELGMTIVAEGVETLPQQEALHLAGVNAVQGYLHAPAMPADTLIDWIKHHAESTAAHASARV